MAAPAVRGDRYAPGGLAARRLPLTPRPKPPCRPIGERLDRVARLAAQADDGGDEAFVRAAEACNLAALIASDCAMPTLARELCWQQFNAYAAAGRPYGEISAKLVLQPLVNLARLRIRDGDGDGGFQILESLCDSARSSRQTAIEGQVVNMSALIQPGTTREMITQWLWAALLTDGLRALCRAARWIDAVRKAQTHDGIGNRLLDGRQIAIVARSAGGHREAAAQILQQTDVSEPWERTVAACLRALIHSADGKAPAGVAAEATSSYLEFEDPGHAMFTVCLGLTAAELTAPRDGQRAIISKITSIATRSRDAYIAREVITSPTARLVPGGALAEFGNMVRHSGLGRPLAAPQAQRLVDSVRSAATVLAAGLQAGSGSPQPTGHAVDGARAPG